MLGFEYGYSLADPRTLVLWEAQFGDFANGAQVIIDQFLASGETKWLRMSGLVLLLPHGYEGQGPEHSSARIERYLAALRRTQHVRLQPDDAGELLPRPAPPVAPQLPQAADRVRAEVAAAPQAGGLSRSPTWRTAAASSSSFPEIDEIAPPEQIRRVVICSGKVYYDLLQERRSKQIKDVAIIRLEQMYPFPERHPGPCPGALPERRCRLVPGRAREHGRLVVCRSADRESADAPGHEGSPSDVCRS